MWSSETFHFNPDWVYYAKEEEGTGDADVGDPPNVSTAFVSGKYQTTPGLKYQIGHGRQVIANVTLQQCQEMCDQPIGKLAQNHELTGVEWHD